MAGLPWDADEIAWARECAAAGDSVEEIAEMAGRPVAEVKAVLADLRPLTERQAIAASLWAAGASTGEIALALHSKGRYPRQSAFAAIKEVRAKGYPVLEHHERVARERQERAHAQA